MRRRSLPLSAALVVLIVLGSGCTADGSAPPAGGSTLLPTPTTTPTATPTSTPAAPPPTGTPAPAADLGPVLDSTALPTGEPPQVAYAFAAHPTFGGGDWELVLPGGSRHPFTETPALFSAHDDVVVNGFGTEGGFVVELFDGLGRLQHEQRGLCSYAMVTSPERDVVAWLQDDGSLVEQSADGSVDTRPVRVPGGPCGGAVAPVALNGPDLYVDGPRVAPSRISGPGEAVAIPQLRDLVDVALRGNLVGRLAGDDGCWGLLRADGVRRWRTCADRLSAFSPGGRHVLGTRGSVAYAGFRGLVVHGARTGRVEAQWSNLRGQRVSQIEWEDADHLLVVVHHAAVGWSVVRLGVDGTAEYAVPPVRTGDGEFAAFRLPMS